MAAVHRRNLNSLAAHLGRFFFLFISIFIGPILWALPGFYRVFTASDLVEPDWTGFLLGSIECYRVFFNDLFITDGCRSFVAVFFFATRFRSLFENWLIYWRHCRDTEIDWNALAPIFVDLAPVLPSFTGFCRVFLTVSIRCHLQ